MIWKLKIAKAVYAINLKGSGVPGQQVVHHCVSASVIVTWLHHKRRIGGPCPGLQRKWIRVGAGNHGRHQTSIGCDPDCLRRRHWPNTGGKVLVVANYVCEVFTPGFIR